MQTQNKSPSFLPFLAATLLLIGQFLLMWLLPLPLWLAGNKSFREVQNWLAWGVWGISMFFLFAPVFILRKRGGVAKKASYVETQTLVTDGLYSLVRHPQYLGWLLMYLAMIIFNPNGAVVVCGAAGMIIMVLITRLEDHHLIEKFGSAYEQYRDTVPALNLLLGIILAIKKNSSGNNSH